MIDKREVFSVKAHELIERMADMVLLKASKVIERSHGIGIDKDGKLRLMMVAVACQIAFSCGMDSKDVAVFRHSKAAGLKRFIGKAIGNGRRCKAVKGFIVFNDANTSAVSLSSAFSLPNTI